MSASFEFPVYSRFDLEVASGEGCRIQTTDHKSYLDLYGGHAVAALGYGHKGLTQALQDQAAKLLFQTNAVHLEVRERACRALANFAPEGIDRAFLVNSGAEANENALRIAFRLTKRKRAVALTHGWHGRTAATAALSSGSEKWYAFPQMPFEVAKVQEDDVAALDRALKDDVACLILEPVQGLAGAKDLSLEFLREARRLTAERGILFICDEVQCGMGRTGTPFAIEAAEVIPDIITTAKALGGGFPVAALLSRADIANQLPVGALGTTFGGGPLAAAAILAVVEVLRSEGFLAHVQKMGALIREHCLRGPVIGIQGRGLLVGLRTERPAKEVLKDLLAQGILAGGADDPHIIRVMPPLILTETDVMELAKALGEIRP